MPSRTPSRWNLVILILLTPAIAAPSGLGEHGCGGCGSSNEPAPAGPTGYGPAYGPIAVGARLTIDRSGQLVSGDAFEIPEAGTLHAINPGSATVRFQSSVGPKDVDYRALAADAIDVDPAWCRGRGNPCLAGVDASTTTPLRFQLYAGGKTGTSLEAGDLCPFAATPSIQLVCDYAPGNDTIGFRVVGEGMGTVTSSLDPGLQLSVEGVPLAAVDALEVSFGPVAGNPGNVLAILGAAKTGGREIVIDGFARRFTLDPASQRAGCQFANNTAEGSHDLTSNGTQPAYVALVGARTGSCTVRVELVGTTVAGTATHAF